MHGLRYFATAIGAGIIVGAICCALAFVPWISDLEQAFGLRWLFQLRGPLPPPQEVVIVAMNRQSASNVYLPKDPEKFQRCREIRSGAAPGGTHVALPELTSRWPRCLHAELVDRLAAAGARVIAFDVLFRKRPPLGGSGEDIQAWQDQAMARAFSSRRVLIAQDFEDQEATRLIELSPVIADAALGSAPFRIVNSHERYDRFLVFIESEWPTPSLPALALQAYALDTYPRLAELLAHTASNDFFLSEPGSDHAVSDRLEITSLLVRNLFREDLSLADRLLSYAQSDPASATRDPVASTVGPDRGSTDAHRQIRSVIAMYSGESDRFINFYGPAGTMTHVGYDEALGAPPDRMRELFQNRVVFVGSSEPTRLKQVDHFPTVFSSESGLNISGVEIAATAFGNLLHDSSIRQVPQVYWTVLVFIFGFMTTVVGRMLSLRLSLSVLAAATAGFAGLVFYMFSSRTIWIPFVLPLFLATPAGLLTALTWNFRTTRRQRENIRNALANFIPAEVVDQFERNAKDFGTTKQKLDCGCVATDAANYTPLAESMDPDALTDFLNQYFEALFRPVGSHGGFVSDVVGDAMLAIWPSRSPDTHAGMLTALLKMRDAARHFNEHFAQGRLLTRFGLDWGPVALATVGAHRHYEYRAVGDTVNTAARIQELNKKLGTTVLLSRRSVGPAGDGFLIRDMGRFVLRGKKIPVDICELVELGTAASPEQCKLRSQFEQCLQIAYQGTQAAALTAFRELHDAYPMDGPTSFYVLRLQSGQGPVDGILKVD